MTKNQKLKQKISEVPEADRKPWSQAYCVLIGRIHGELGRFTADSLLLSSED